VIDSGSGLLYGYVVSGIPESGTAYLMPAQEVIKEIDQFCGGLVHFPKFSEQMAEDTRLFLASDPETTSSRSLTTIHEPFEARFADLSLVHGLGGSSE
jgi:hypothetical protein